MSELFFFCKWKMIKINLFLAIEGNNNFTVNLIYFSTQLKLYSLSTLKTTRVDQSVVQTQTTHMAEMSMYISKHLYIHQNAFKYIKTHKN